MIALPTVCSSNRRPDRWVAVFGQGVTNSNAHNWVLQYLSTLGVIGGCLLAAVLAVGLWRARPRLAAQPVSASVIVASAVWIGLLGYVVQMMLNVAVLASTVPFWVLLGVVSAPRARRFRLSRVAGVGMVVACGLLLLASIVCSYRLVAADAVYLSARVSYHDRAYPQSLALAEKAVVLNPLSVKYRAQ